MFDPRIPKLTPLQHLTGCWRALIVGLMTTHIHAPAAPPPPDATEVGPWQIDHDGTGRPFWGTVRCSGGVDVRITGWQYADGEVSDRSIVLTNLAGGALETPAVAKLTAFDIIAAACEIEALQ
jgi:hypothetical protein